MIEQFKEYANSIGMNTATTLFSGSEVDFLDSQTEAAWQAFQFAVDNIGKNVDAQEHPLAYIKFFDDVDESGDFYHFTLDKPECEGYHSLGLIN